MPTNPVHMVIHLFTICNKNRSYVFSIFDMLVSGWLTYLVFRKRIEIGYRGLILLG